MTPGRGQARCQSADRFTQVAVFIAVFQPLVHLAVED
jgi:hypothetical protein